MRRRFDLALLSAPEGIPRRDRNVKREHSHSENTTRM
jgi:hypothetical protein